MNFQRNTCCQCVHFTKDLHASTELTPIYYRLLHMNESYLTEVLKRVVSTIKLLSRLGLAFRGHEEDQHSNRKGNYLTCMEYLSEYDIFLNYIFKNTAVKSEEMIIIYHIIFVMNS